ncbi:MAG: class I SAM-dependent methyltransferase [bacterium]|nr:class I SAM-dependent methyltransferase [bacterium]
MWRWTFILLVISTASCVDVHHAATIETEGGPAESVTAEPPAIRQGPTSPGDADSAPVRYAGREPFQPMPADEPAIEAVLAGPALEAHHRIQSDLPVHAAGVRRGQTVADVGCGDGRISVQLARHAGAEGLVYCRDINAGRIETLHERVAAEAITNMDVAINPKDNVNLAAGSIELALLSDVFHFVLRQEDTADGFLSSLFASLKPGGIVVVVYSRTTHLRDPDRRAQVYRQTLDRFAAHGFVPGRRYSFAQEESFPAQILEFRRPGAGDGR